MEVQILTRTNKYIICAFKKSWKSGQQNGKKTKKDIQDIFIVDVKDKLGH